MDVKDKPEIRENELIDKDLVKMLNDKYKGRGEQPPFRDLILLDDMKEASKTKFIETMSVRESN